MEFFRQPILTNHVADSCFRFASRRANKVAKWKIGINWLQSSSCGYDLAHVANF